jgi:hypothetical protein
VAEIRGVERQLRDAPTSLSVLTGIEQVSVYVVYDDGTLQRWADATYGAGVVLVSSALVDAQ